MISFSPSGWTVAVVLVVSGGTASTQNMDSTIDALSRTRSVPVNIDNFVRAATDIELDKYVALGGGVNAFFHFLEPTDVNTQPTIRMNRDTLYSTVVIDISDGATLTSLSQAIAT